MTRGGRSLLLALAALALAPAGAGAHAYLIGQKPDASVVLERSPARVVLSYNEPIDEKFSLISVTDKDANRVTTGLPLHTPGSRSEIEVPLEKLAAGWYLIYWRVISADGHPIRGASTFAIGPSPGPPPQFDVPSLEETAATPSLLVLRWLVLLSLMSAVGLLAFRLVIGRPMLRRVPDSSLRAVSAGFGISVAVAVLGALALVNEATADFTESSFFDLGTTVPLWRDSAYGRGFSDFAIVAALLGLAGAAALLIDRPDRERRSLAELGALTGAVAAAAAALAMPGLSGHAGQNSPRGLALALDWVHLLSGGIWIGGLLAITLVAWKAATHRVACMVVVVPRFSRVALGAVAVLVGAGTVTAVLQLPTLESLWETGYGQALIAKIAILFAALGLAAVNLLRTKPRLEATERQPGLGEPTTRSLRRLVGAEAFLVIGAVFAAGIMSSVAPPPDALAQLGSAQAKVGPSPVKTKVTESGYDVEFGIAPNKAAQPNAFSVRVLRDGVPIKGATVTARFSMLDMEMGVQRYRFTERQPGVYSHPNLPALVMAGHWGLDFTIAMGEGQPLQVLLLDEVRG